jgi:hypothetical protein
VAWPEIVFGVLLILALLVLSGEFGRRQVLSLRRLRQTPELPADEVRYERRKAYRRLVSCGLTLILAVLLAVLLALYEGPALQLAEERKGHTAETAPSFTEDQLWFLRIWGGTWFAFLLILTAVLILAVIDLLATRRYGLGQFRKLQADRRAMIERQARRMRRDRNGHG